MQRHSCAHTPVKGKKSPAMRSFPLVRHEAPCGLDNLRFAFEVYLLGFASLTCEFALNVLFRDDACGRLRRLFSGFFKKASLCVRSGVS